MTRTADGNRATEKPTLARDARGTPDWFVKRDLGKLLLRTEWPLADAIEIVVVVRREECRRDVSHTEGQLT